MFKHILKAIDPATQKILDEMDPKAAKVLERFQFRLWSRLVAAVILVVGGGGIGLWVAITSAAEQVADRTAKATAATTLEPYEQRLEQAESRFHDAEKQHLESTKESSKAQGKLEVVLDQASNLHSIVMQASADHKEVLNQLAILEQDRESIAGGQVEAREALEKAVEMLSKANETAADATQKHAAAEEGLRNASEQLSKAESLAAKLAVRQPELEKQVKAHANDIVRSDGYRREIATDVSARHNAGAPIGSIVAWPGTAGESDTPDTLPPGWVVCRGQAIDPDWQVGKLRAVLGGRDRLPDLRGYFLRGFDPSREVDPETRGLGSVQGDALAEHSHKAGRLKALVMFHGTENTRSDNNLYWCSASETWNATNRWGIPGPKIAGFSDTRKEFDSAVKVVGETGSQKSTSGETRPKNIAVHWIIRVK